MDLQRPSKSTGQYTTSDIARLAGVSQAVVSKILNGGRGNARASKQTIQRVMEIAQQCGYRRNMAAASTRRGRFGSVAMVLSALGEGRSELPMQMLTGLIDALEERNLHLSIAKLDDHALTSDAFMPKILREWSSDGLLINYNKTVPPTMVELVEKLRIPSVWLNCKRAVNAVYADDFHGGKLATQYLLGLRHRRIAYVTLSHKLESLHYSEMDRAAGYRQAMAEAALPALYYDRYNCPAGLVALPRVDRAQWILSQEPRPTAIVTYGPTSSTPVLAAAERKGLRIPRDLSLVTFHDMVAFSGMDTTTALTPNAQVGRDAVEMLMERLDAPDDPLPSIAAPYSMLVSQTTAPPR